jgi:hypothetical protein
MLECPNRIKPASCREGFALMMPIAYTLMVKSKTGYHPGKVHTAKKKDGDAEHEEFFEF